MTSRQNLEIVPSNQTSTGTMSYVSGNPVIQFIIGEQDRLLVGNSVRLVGDFQVFFNSAGDIATSDGVANTGGTLRMSESLGVYSVIDQLVIKSQATHQTIEEIRHYPRFLGSYLPVTTSSNDGIGHLSETALITPAYTSQKFGVVDIKSMNNSANSFAINLPCGLFNGANPIPLQANGEGGLGGLLVEIHLAPDSNVLFDALGGGDTTGSYYQLKNVRLVAEAVTPDPRERLPPANTFEYNSISSYFTTFNSGNAIVNFNLGLSRVLGVFGNIVPASFINNTDRNGLALTNPLNSDGGLTSAEIQQLIFTRGGERFPLDYNIDTPQKSRSSDTQVDSQITRNYMNAIKQFAKLHRTQISPVNTKYTTGTDAVTNFKPDGGSVFGVGVAYDVISGDGVDFSNVNWGCNMSLNLTTDSPNAFYLFVHSKNTLAFSRDGISVVK
jgi:hypothetical protein